jgi:predicted RNase H-like nuclease (RuvC/YqgF family)
MDSNKHDHKASDSSTPTKNSVSTTFIILVALGVVLVLGVIGMGYNLVKSSQQLTEFQQFTVAVLSALTVIITGYITKQSIDKNKSEERMLAHEEKMETIRLQTNGRLHKRDEQLESFRKLVTLLVQENRRLTNELRSFKNELTLSSEALHEAVDTVKNSESKTIIVESADEAIKELAEEIAKKDEELKNLRPFYPKDAG